MTAWDGQERRDEHCGMHADNTRTLNTAAADISAIKSNMSMGRWILGILVGVAVVVVGATMSEIKSGIEDIRNDTKGLKTLEYRIDRLERDANYYHGRDRNQ